MVKARQLSHSPKSVKRRLWESPWQWNHRPGWDYVGKDRVIWGHSVDARSFSIRTNSTRGIIWTIQRQAWAVEQGFFVHRELIRERPVIIGVNRYDHSTFSYEEPVKTMREIERRVFQCIPGYGVLYNFIEQQDRYGFTGAWDIRVMNFTPDLLWYKMFIEAHGGMAARKAHLHRIAAQARERKYVNTVRNMIKHGHIPGDKA